MREINVSCAEDPVHAGDKALTRESPAQRGRVNRYVTTNTTCFLLLFLSADLILGVILKSDSTHHFFRNACTKSGSLRFSQFSDC